MRLTIAALASMVFGFLSMNSSAWSADDSMSLVLPGYIKIQEALAHDSMDGVASAAAEIQKKAASKSIKNAAKRVATAKNLKAARAAFKELSKPIVSWAQQAKPTEYEIVDCSMAGAKWVQKRGTIQNPYYGKEMLECGEKVS